MDQGMTTTTFEIAGQRIVRQLGVVRGITVRSRSLVGNIGAAFQILFGGNISLYTQLCERARQEAFEIMVSHAEAIGANAVLGVRYDATSVASAVSEVRAYGTAAVVERT